MLHRPQRTRTRLRQLADAGLFAVAFGAAYFLRANFRWFDLSPLEPFADYLRLLPAVALLCPLVLHTQGLYDPPRVTGRLAAAFVILRGCFSPAHVADMHREYLAQYGHQDVAGMEELSRKPSPVIEVGKAMGLSPSTSEASRLIGQGGVSIYRDNQPTPVTDPKQPVLLEENMLVKAGKKKIARLSLQP